MRKLPRWRCRPANRQLRDSGSRWGPLGHRCRGPAFKKLGLKPLASAQLNRAVCFAGSTVWAQQAGAQQEQGATQGHSGANAPRGLSGVLWWALWLAAGTAWA